MRGEPNLQWCSSTSRADISQEHTSIIFLIPVIQHLWNNLNTETSFHIRNHLSIHMYLHNFLLMNNYFTYIMFQSLYPFYDLYLWSLVKFALVASAVPCAPAIERTQLAVTPSHKRMVPSLEAVTYMPPVAEYLTWCTKMWIWLPSSNFIYL